MSQPHKHRARKRFGQHFLHDRNIIQKLLRAINPQAHDALIEIGPGQGALTFPLLQRCHKLTAIELDKDLIPILQRKAPQYGELTLINRDILQTDIGALELTPPYRIVGNLPYNISTPLMFHLLAQSSLIKDMHFMVQKEVAQRIIARSGDKHYGRLSIMMEYYCSSEYLFDVAPGCFSPPPKVDSAIIRLIPHRQPPLQVDDLDKLGEVVKAAFSQRRKTIGNSLKKLLERSQIEALDIDPRQRAENLSLQDFARLANLLKQS